MKEWNQSDWLHNDNINFGIIVEYQVSDCPLQHPDIPLDTLDDTLPFDPRLSKFFYPPKKIMTKQELVDWSTVMCCDVDDTTPTTLYKWSRIVFYTVETYNIASIRREKDWFNRVRGTLKDAHSKLEWLQQDICNYQSFQQELDSHLYEDCLL
jgi:hypothetical protein